MKILALMAGLLVSLPAYADGIDGADTAWIMTATALVLMMTIPGLSLFYGGLVRSKNVLSVLMQCFTITCVMSILWMVRLLISLWRRWLVEWFYWWYVQFPSWCN
jgi:Amt family ammonium transporter